MPMLYASVAIIIMQLMFSSPSILKVLAMGALSQFNIVK